MTDPHVIPSRAAIMEWCAYCGIRAEVGRDLEIRNGKFVCEDVQACDARELVRDLPEEAEDG